MARGHIHAELGHWDQAAIDFSRAISFGVDDEQVEYYLALAHLATEDWDGYREVYTRLRRRLSETRCAPTVNLVAWCYALPAIMEDSPPSEPMLEAIARLKLMPRGTIWLLPLQSAAAVLTVLDSTMGACLYRQGRFDEAAEYLRASEEDDEPDALRCLCMATTRYRLGQQEEARDWLQKAAKAKEDGKASVAQQIYGHPDWVVRLEYDILRREAEVLIQPQQ